jgi:regulator of cell morphogenesis and NO signaling
MTGLPESVGPRTLVREILMEVAGATEAFERHHVDYCCGGALPLEEACARASVAVDVMMATLAEEAGKPGAETTRDREMLSIPLAEIVARIVDEHHERSRRDATELVARARAAADAEGDAIPALRAIAKHLEVLFAELLPHLVFEERHVFPYVVGLERTGREGGLLPVALFASIAEPIADMIREHESADHALHAIRDLASDYAPPDGASERTRELYAALAANEKELVRHMHLEGNVLFPRAERLETKLRDALRTARRSR